MTTDLLLDFDGMDSLGSRITAAATSISSLLVDLERQVAALRGQWTGEASNAYDSAHESWTRELGQITAILNEISAAVGAAREGYTVAERENAQRWS